MTGADSSSKSPWILRYPSASDAPLRLLCLPHAGGSASFYGGLARALGPRAETLAVQYPGRMERRHERLLTRIDDLAEGLLAELAPWSDRRLAVFGHSLGAVLGFEVARRLEAMGRPPVALFVSGRGAPSRHRREFNEPLDERTLVEQMRKLGGTDPRVFDNEELLQLALPVMRADYEAVESYRYRPGPPLSCPVIALNGEEDPKVPDGEADAWAEHTTGSFRKFTMPGGHFYLVDRQAEVADIIAGRAAPIAATTEAGH